MGDYDFSGLSTRSFEHLVQSLAARLIGDRVSVFGDGPDGGREATFEGPTLYGAPHPWDGYGVVQAKFKQRSEGTTRDGAWAVAQLKGELTSLPTRAAGVPDYYLFVTNVVLSPGEGGFKDQAHMVLRNFVHAHHMKAFDVWDYDKLRALLDLNRDIRMGYAAWITAGDVLSELAEWVGGLRPDFDDILERFLSKELLADQYSKLGQAGHAADEAIPLATVFVDLPSSDSPSDQTEDRNQLGIVRLLTDVAREELKGAWTARPGVPPRSPMNGRVVLIGGPGQGKSTIGQFLCQLFRAAFLRDFTAASLSPSVVQAIDLIEMQSEKEGLDIPGVKRLPLRVPLNDYATKLATDPDLSLLRYWTNQIRARTDSEISPDELRSFLGVCPCFVVLDGLDEVPPSTNRTELMRQVDEFFVDLASASSDVLVLATSRPQGYSEDFSPKHFHHRWLMPLSVPLGLHYASRLTQVRYGNDFERVETVMDRLRRASEEDATARLMESPLQVTIMTFLVDRMGQPPQERWNLFDEYYRLIYLRELERDIPAAAVLRNHQSDIDTIHRHCGLLLQLESERSGGTNARLTTDQFKQLVNNRLESEGHEGENLSRLTDAIIDAAATRLVFLVGLEQGQVGFEIRSLQEFMAAEGLMDADDSMTQVRLRSIAGSENWRNVYLFCTGKVFSKREYLRDSVTAICAELNQGARDQSLAAIAAGSTLALDLLQDRSATRAPRYHALLTETALELLQRPAHNEEEFRRLADVFQDDFFDAYERELSAAFASTDPARRMGAVYCVTALAEAHPDLFSEMGRSMLANIISDIEMLFSAMGTVRGKNPLLEDFLQGVLSHPPRRSFLPLDPSRNELPSWADLWFRFWDQIRETAVHLVDYEPVSGVRCSFRSIEGWTGSRLHAFATLPEAHPAWAPLRLWAQFGENPSPDSLSDVLIALAQVRVKDRQDVLGYMRHAGPWPLSMSILNSDNDTSKLAALAEDARRGLLGTLEDWSMAEKRWREEGARSKDVAWGARHPSVDSSIAERGFPMRATTFYFSDSDTTPLLDACAYFMKHRDAPEAIMLAEAVADSIVSREAFALVVKETLGPDVLLSLAEVALDEGDFYTGGELLDLVEIDAVPEELALKLNAAGLDAADPPLGPEDDTVLRRALENLSSPRGVIALLGECARWNEKFEPIPDLEEFADDSLDHVRAAVVAMELRCGMRVDAARRRIVEVRKSLDDRASWFASPISYSNRPLAEKEAELLSLYALEDTDEWQSRYFILRHLSATLAQRTSDLGSRQVWISAGFPERLWDVVTSPGEV